MITSVMFDMGGTLEDIYVDERSEWAAIEKLDRMLREGGLDPQVDLTELKRRVDAGWKRYGAFRDSCDVELKPIPIWCDYALADFGFPRDVLEPLCEPIAYMWELTHYHRSLRPRVREMLGGLRQLGLKLGIISNTAAMYQVFDSLEEYGIRDLFEDVTLSSVTGLRKPRPDIFLVSTHQLRVKPEDCVYVGDTVSRLQADRGKGRRRAPGVRAGLCDRGYLSGFSHPARADGQGEPDVQPGRRRLGLRAP